MRCTSIKKNECGKCLNQKLTDYCSRLIFNLLHITVVPLSPIERVRLFPRASIAISILAFRTFIGIMSGLRTLETGDVAQIPLGWC